MLELREVVEHCVRKGFPYHIEGENPLLLLFGEGRGEKERHNIGLLPDEEVLIELVRPQVVLHEQADPQLFDKAQTPRIFGWELQYGLTVKLCDIPNVNRDKPKVSKRYMDYLFWGFLSGFPQPIPKSLDLYIEMTNPLREMYMGSLIAKEIQDNRTPLFAVVGNDHLMPDSGIYKILRRAEISYIAALQSPIPVNELTKAAGFFAN